MKLDLDYVSDTVFEFLFKKAVMSVFLLSFFNICIGSCDVWYGLL